MYGTDDDLVELLLIPGVGRTRARALHQAGFRSLGDIASASLEELARVPGIGEAMARDIQRFAADMLSAGGDAGKRLESDASLFVCPLCGSMVSASAGQCPNCGVVFEGEEEEVAGAGVDGDGEADGYWYRDDARLFICPECGSLVADGADRCPGCGVMFEGEEEVEPDTVPEGVERGEDGFWYRDEARLYICPGCGAFIPADAGSCPHCGVVFEGEEDAVEPGPPTCPMCGTELAEGQKECTECGFRFGGDADGFWYDEQKGLYMCPECGSFIPSDADKCPRCGVVLEGEEEAEPEPPGEMLCPMCGSSLARDQKECPDCGFSFLEEDADGFWYRDRASLFLCPECGAFVSESATRCQNCGTVFEEEVEEKEETAPASPGGPDEEELEQELEELISGEDEPVPEPAAPEIYLCPVCGALISAGLTRCPSCDTVLDDIEELDLAPLGVEEVTAAADLEDISREIEEEIGSIERDMALPPAEPKEPAGPRGVSRDFLDRWKKLTGKAEAGPRDEDIEEIELEPEPVPEAAETTGDYDYWRHQAEELAAAGDVERAVACLERAAEADPERETECKRRILELLGVGEMTPAVPEPGELEEELGDLAVEEALETLELQEKLAKVDGKLKDDPGSAALWQEKGEILEKLGRHPEAVECFDRSIDISYAALTRDAGRGLRQPQIRVGLTNGQGRINGSINGLMGQRRSLTNGRVGIRGRVNGMVNGLTNGRTNGMVNGRGRVNGMVNGLTNGRTNGLINGLGLVNGEGMVNGSRGIRRLRARQRERFMWRYRLTAMVLFITAILLISMLGNLVEEQRTGAINIDGNFADWSNIPAYLDSPVDQPENPDINMVMARVLPERDRLSMYLRVDGTILAGGGNVSGGGVDTVAAFVDLDNDPETGYAVGGLGADMLVDIYGWDNEARVARCMQFNDEDDRDDWNGFEITGTAPVGLEGPEMEFRLYVPRYIENTAEHPGVLLMLMGSDGSMDTSDFLMSDMPAGLGITSVPGSAGLLQPGDNDIILARLSARASLGSPVLTGLNFTLLGTVDPAELGNLRLVNDINRNGVLDHSDTQPDASITAGPGGTLAVSITGGMQVPLNRSLELLLAADLGEDASGTLGVLLANATAPESSVRLLNEKTTLAYVGTPLGIGIDGAFADWAEIQANVDPGYDVVSPNPNATLVNRNVDLADFRAVMGDELNVYLAVFGRMLGGADIPTLRTRPGGAPAPVQTDTDRDSVPDIFDPMPFDFDNDGVNNSDENGDWDSDGYAEYPAGEDYWLNTTIPLDFPANWAGNFVSVYVGPIDVKNPGYDSAYIMLDVDSSQGTGTRMFDAVGIDAVALITGKHNRIVSSQMFRFSPAAGDIPWEYLGEVDAAVDWYRMELAIDPMLLGAPPGGSITVYASIQDWNRDYDTGQPLLVNTSSGTTALTGTRSPAGDNIVLNEISTLPNDAEWIEVANPTGSPVDLGGWYIQVQVFGWRTIYTFPAGTVAGAWGSGSEYVLAADPFWGPWWLFGNQLLNGINVRLRDAGGTIVDATTIGTVSAGQTWARFKNSTWGMPLDTDSGADWYVSNDGWLVPEGPTPGAPNGRTRPVIAVEKVGDMSQAAPGQFVNYTIYYNNTGDGLARHVWVNDTLPAGIDIVSSVPPYSSQAGSIYQWYFTNVQPGSVNSITILARVNSSAPAGSIQSNSVTLDYTDQLSRPLETSADTWNITIIGPSPVISVRKSASSGQVVPGGGVAYTIWYNNTGVASAPHVWVNDTLPGDITFYSASPPPDSTAGQDLYWHFTDVAPGTHSITLYGNVSSSAAAGSVLTNTVSCEFTDQSGTVLSGGSDSASVTVVDPMFQVVMNEISIRGNNNEWVEVANPTDVPVDISGWRIRVGWSTVYTFPAGTVLGPLGSGTEYFVADTGGGNDFPNGGALVRLQWDSPGPGWTTIDRTRYPNGITDTQTWSRFKHEDTGTPVDTDNDANDWYVSNNNWLVPEGPTPGAPNDRKRPVMTLEKSADTASAEPGQTVTYTLWYNNTGDGNAKNVWLNDTLPAGVDFVSANPPPDYTAGQDIGWYFPNIVHDSSQAITVTVLVNDQAADGGTMVNQADLTYHDQLKRPMGTVQAWANVTCLRPVITVSKVSDVANASANDTITYTIYYNNTGSASAGDVWINDTLPAGVSFSSASTAPDSIDGQNLSWHFTNVAPGAHSLTVTVTVDSNATSGTAVNWAYLDYASSYGYMLESSSDSAVVVIPEFRNTAAAIAGILVIMFIAFGRRRSRK